MRVNAFTVIVWVTIAALSAAEEVQTVAVSVVDAHVGGDEERQGPFIYDVPTGYEIIAASLIENRKWGDASYSGPFQEGRRITVAWQIKSHTVRGPFKTLLDTKTASLALTLDVKLRKVNPPQPTMDASQIVTVSIGVFFILLLLGLVFWRRNLTAAEYTFARIVLALAVACIAIMLTGFLKVEFKGMIQAGGAFAVFVIVYLMAPAGLQGSSEWQNVRQLWQSRRDLHDLPSEVNRDDLASTVNAVNETARLIENDDSLWRPFKTDYGSDFCRLYRKLLNNKYPMPQANATSDQLLSLGTHRLAKRIPCES